MERCRKPIIGEVSGLAVTTGFEISLACDILIASTDAQFVDTHARFVGDVRWMVVVMVDGGCWW
ncbi:putative enoyl-CoA hydratase/isomerase, ClpP/crotonase-like domain superfamily [Helianthus annuus]|nr:putative enoyl-CoA hydratase/isomerase, ClpP/crotonase-like domain superfamily [Helianthus annuus]